VKVVRDQNGLVNIYASTPTDLFAAQGWVHASGACGDGSLAPLGAGRLAELFGESADTDQFTDVGLATGRPARPRCRQDAQDPDAYSSGVNAWLDTHADLPCRLSPASSAGRRIIRLQARAMDGARHGDLAESQARSLGSNWDSELFG
jgi:acyl-homoserine lactone acylase PvdQ